MNYTEKNKFIDSLCGIGLMLILVELFYLIVDSAYTAFNYDFNVVTACTQGAGAVFLLIAILVLIRAYRKDNTTTAVYGIEMLVLAITAALLPGTYLSFSYPFNKLNTVFPWAFGFYYLIKLLVIVIKAKKKANKSKGKKK